MLTELTEKIITLTLQSNFNELQKILDDLTYSELSLLYVMCLNLSKKIRLAPNFNKPPYKDE